jgi:hypothetical protein
LFLRLCDGIIYKYKKIGEKNTVIGVTFLNL